MPSRLPFCDVTPVYVLCVHVCMYVMYVCLCVNIVWILGDGINTITSILVSSTAPGCTNQAKEGDESDSKLQLQDCTED